IERAVALCPGTVIGLDDLPEFFHPLGTVTAAPDPVLPALSPLWGEGGRRPGEATAPAPGAGLRASQWPSLARAQATPDPPPAPRASLPAPAAGYWAPDGSP